MITLEELKKQERQLYNERDQLYKINQERNLIPIRELSKLIKEEFKKHFKDNGFIPQNDSNDNKITMKSKSIAITLEKTDENCFAFSLGETNDYPNCFCYTIMIEETEKTICYSTFNGILNEEGNFFYTRNYTEDTVTGVQEQINKLRTDINIISSKTDLPKFVFKLGDHKYSYLNKEFEDIVDLFEEILSKYKF